ncbi:MAG: alpha/beta hydrolase, partial [Jiangellaceae bacterium]
MSRRELIDPELLPTLDALLGALPGGFNAVPDIVQRRAAIEAMNSGIEVPETPNVVKEDRAIDSNVSVRIYRPVNGAQDLPGILFIHGGGMIMGSVAGEDPTAA